jgi:hypothetical protein
MRIRARLRKYSIKGSKTLINNYANPTTLPVNLRLNAFTAEAEGVHGSLSSEFVKWSLRTTPTPIERYLRPPEREDPNNWRDWRVGWGLVTFEQPGFSDKDYADNRDLSPYLRQLLEKRESNVVLRFRQESGRRYTLLRDYRNQKDVDIAASGMGKGPSEIPRYLLLVGRPTSDELPWSLQYALSMNRCVGRLPFHPMKDDIILQNYIKACLDDWAQSNCDWSSPLVWAVDHGRTDITHLMRQSIAETIFSKYSTDGDLKAKAMLLTDEQATNRQLIDHLKSKKPGLVVTTSHGMTGPIEDRDRMSAQLGLPVDQQKTPLNLQDLLSNWNPGGVVWYAHACCGAGSDNGSLFAELFTEGTDARRVLTAIGDLGAQVAPLPLALLSADNPARGFLGHVEPTFDWTLLQSATGQFLTFSLQKALYNEIFLRAPIGQAFREWYNGAGTHYAAWDAAKKIYDGSESARASVFYHNLAAHDVQSLVLLGDPAVAIPPL